MKNKKIIFLIFIFSLLLAVPILTNARVLDMVDITYEPNVPIPIEVNGYNFAEKNVIKGGDFLASYIVAIYTYGAGFAGIVAMFMLVIAGWRWLFAAGNASKIEASKDMVTSTLIGLALLFGGQLLLSQISDDFKSIQSLNIELDPKLKEALTGAEGSTLFCPTGGGTSQEPKEVEDCSDYKNAQQCYSDVCKIVSANDFDSRCIPYFNKSDNSFTKCGECPSSCPCSWYAEELGSVFYKNEDPCDCDEDEKWTDDVCEDPPANSSSRQNIPQI